MSLDARPPPLARQETEHRSSSGRQFDGHASINTYCHKLLNAIWAINAIWATRLLSYLARGGRRHNNTAGAIQKRMLDADVKLHELFPADAAVSNREPGRRAPPARCTIDTKNRESTSAARDNAPDSSMCQVPRCTTLLSLLCS